MMEGENVKGSREDDSRRGGDRFIREVTRQQYLGKIEARPYLHLSNHLLP